MGAIVPYREQHLEQIGCQDLLKLDDINRGSRFFMPGSLYVGSYNQAGFVLVDSQPPKNRPYWIGSDILYPSSEQIERDIDARKLEPEKRYWHDMSRGMVAVRHFALSETLMRVFDQDRFIGPAMIEKILEEDLVPDYFEEEAVVKMGRDRIWEYDPTSNASPISSEMNRILAPIKERAEGDHTMYAYATYFPTNMFGVVVPTLEQAVQEAVARFDAMMARFGMENTHPDVPRNLPLLKATQ